ncbi:MAG: hypothetical protein P1P85_04740 [Patescibacteria group bacterium]|nr:hypothetical protein [Patescibacteria group bacterium]
MKLTSKYKKVKRMSYCCVPAQKCVIEDEVTTVIYGHIRLSSVEKNVRDEFIAGEKLGVLGKGYRSETDGERKHLHLSIHKGSELNILGYIQIKQELENWIDVEKFL